MPSIKVIVSTFALLTLIGPSFALSMPTEDQFLEIRDPSNVDPSPKKLREGGILILERRDRDVSDRIHTAIAYVNEVTMTIGVSEKLCGDKTSSDCAQSILESEQAIAETMKPVPLSAWGKTMEAIDGAISGLRSAPSFDAVKTRKLATIWSLELKKRGFIQETAVLSKLKQAQEKAQLLRVQIAVGLLITPDRVIEVATLHAYGPSHDSSIPATSQPLFSYFGETAESDSLAVQDRIEKILNEEMATGLLQFAESMSNSLRRSGRGPRR